MEIFLISSAGSGTGMGMRSVALALALALAGAGMAAADESSIGRVKTVAGTVMLLRGEQRLEATPGTALFAADVLETGDGGAAGMTLKDNTMLSIGPGSRVAIDVYEFAPTEGKLGFVATLARGTLQYISGAIGRLAPDGVTVRTPAADIAVRGARILVRAEAEGE
jgi:hypothetical protein